MKITLPSRALCARALDDLFNKCDGITSAMLALRDGRPYVEKTRTKGDVGKFAAMSSSLVALGNSILKELACGTLNHVLVEGSTGKLVVCNVPFQQGILILAVHASNEATLGLVLGHARTCAQEVAGAAVS
jgi:predicted regulator of Ras-like GTPase activity (Roadblock/LC7/MglB family)